MAYSLKRLEKCNKMSEEFGYKEAARRMNIKTETLRRNVRAYKNKTIPKTPVQKNGADKMAERIARRFSEDELKALLDDSQRLTPKSRISKIDFSGEWVKLAVISDPHTGSQYSHDEDVYNAIEACNREGCEYFLCTGDVTEGMSGRDGHISELRHIGYKAQRAAAVGLWKNAKSPIKMISGNHDLWYASRGNTGAIIVEDICQILKTEHGINAEYLGEHEGRIVLNGAALDMWHGLDGAAYALSYRIQKIIESLEESELPKAIFAGHDHKSIAIPDLRGIYSFGCGCLEDQTPWMRQKKLRAFKGFWMIELCIRDGNIIRVRPEWFKIPRRKNN